MISKLSKYLENKFHSNVEIKNLKSLSGGACQDNYSMDLTIHNGENSGEYPLVLRKDKGASLVASLDRIQEYHVTHLAWSHGVKTPRPMWLEEDSSALDSPFYFMDRIQGNADGRYFVKHPSLNGIRSKIGRDLAEGLAKIHSIEPRNTDSKVQDILWMNGGNSTRSAEIALRAVESLRKELARHEEGYPGMELVLNWLEMNAKPTSEPVLVHGDFRTGNFMVNSDGLQGIMDWEFAHWGDFHEDLTWICLRDWRFGKVKLEAGGFMSRQEFYHHYEKLSGRRVDPDLVTYWEVMGNLRWAIGCLGQAERHLSGKDKGIELASIGRRACEMEWEAMRLIEHAR